MTKKRVTSISLHMKRIGTKGGLTTKKRYGKEHYSKLGSKGGDTTKKRLGADHYKKIADARWAKVRKAKKLANK